MGVEKAESDTMKRPPYSPNEGMFSRGAGVQVAWVGALIGGLALALGYVYYFSNQPQWQTMVFSFLAFAQIFQALASRSSRDSFFRMGLSGNPMLAWMVLLVFGLQIAVIYVPALNRFFNVIPLSTTDLAIAIGTGAIVLFAMELEKVIRKRKSKA
jgi:Ca2+-transporting ATPase